MNFYLSLVKPTGMLWGRVPFDLLSNSGAFLLSERLNKRLPVVRIQVIFNQYNLFYVLVGMSNQIFDTGSVVFFCPSFCYPDDSFLSFRLNGNKEVAGSIALVFLINPLWFSWFTCYGCSCFFQELFTLFIQTDDWFLWVIGTFVDIQYVK